jgi:hypothetical protein
MNMNAKKCDRCRMFYEPYEPDAALKHSNVIIFAEKCETSFGESGYVQFELCPGCMQDAVRFMQAMIGEE